MFGRAFQIIYWLGGVTPEVPGLHRSAFIPPCAAAPAQAPNLHFPDGPKKRLPYNAIALDSEKQPLRNSEDVPSTVRL